MNPKEQPKGFCFPSGQGPSVAQSALRLTALPARGLPLGSSASLGSEPVAEATPVLVPRCSPSSRKQNQGALKGSFKINKK